MSNIHDVYSLSNTPLTRPPLARASSTVESLLSRKRKRGAGTTEGAAATATASSSTSAFTPAATSTPALLHGQFAFLIKAQAGHNGTAQAFRCLASTFRSQLPLTFLDNSSTPTRLFSSHLPALEDEAQGLGCREARVLIARAEVDLNGPLYAVERVKSRVYALCGLASWVKLDHIQGLPSSPEGSRHAAPDRGKDDNEADAWWQKCLAPEPDTTALPSLSSRKAPRLCMRQPPSTTQEPACTHPEGRTEARAQAIDGHVKAAAEASASAPATDAVEITAQAQARAQAEAAVSSPEDVFVRFISQYLETLYLSRTPLSFFAKGPVSRARAAFASNQMEHTTLAELAAFLRSMIQSSAAADKKYKDKLPEMLAKIAAAGGGAHGANSPVPVPVKEKKRRKKRRLKVDKYGVFQDEDEYFAQWWHADEASTPAAETAAQCLRRRSAQLRTRETFMQLILVLELLSLEALPEVMHARDTAATADADTSHSQPRDSLSQAKPSKPKTRKSDDVGVTLELLLDKLAIWHSLDSGLPPDNAPAADRAKPTSAPDELRSFCIEVIIPFYLSRCPMHAANVNKKLGGPSAPSSKPRSSISKPGEPDLRQRPDKKARKPLHRVATETAAAGVSNGPPTLRHSHTDSQLLANHVKREASEPPSLSSIPSFRSRRERDSQTPVSTSQPPSRRQSGVAGLKAREVDFGALHAAQEAKAKKKREVDEKLRDAISGLKRPDRLKAGREVMEVAEQRRLFANGRARGAAGVGSKRGVTRDTAKEQASSVHVAATPSHGRSHDVVKATPMRMAQPSFARPNPFLSQPVPSSGSGIVPSSFMRPPPAMLQHADTDYDAFEEVEEDTLVPATGRRQRTVRYELTPSKNQGPRGMSPLREDDEDEDDGHAVAQTPSKTSRSFDIYATPSKSVTKDVTKDKEARGAVASTSLGMPGIVASTPVKQPAGLAATPPRPVAVHKQPETTKSAEQSGGGGQGASLYDALGWNDDFSD